MLNKVQIIGYLGRDPETRYTPDGSAVANASIATSRKWKDKQTGESKEETEWHRVSFFGRTAEVAEEYLAKGSLCYVEGRLQTRKYKDKEGVDRYTTGIVCERLILLGGNGGGGRSRRDDDDGGETRSSRRRGEEDQPAQQEKPKGGYTFDDMDDDIPF